MSVSRFKMKLQKGGFLLQTMCVPSQPLHGQVIKDVRMNTALSFFSFIINTFINTCIFLSGHRATDGGLWRIHQFSEQPRLSAEEGIQGVSAANIWLLASDTLLSVLCDIVMRWLTLWEKQHRQLKSQLQGICWRRVTSTDHGHHKDYTISGFRIQHEVGPLGVNHFTANMDLIT